MTIPSQAVRLAQRRLGFTGTNVDGRLGPGTEKRLDVVLVARKGDLPPRYRDAILAGPRTRKITAYIQLLARDAGIFVGSVDGVWGPQTAFAYDSLAHLERHGAPPTPWRDTVVSTANPRGWPKESTATLEAFYGPKGGNQVLVQLPYAHRLSWDLSKSITRFSCNAKVADSIGKVLTQVRDHYGEQRIRELRLDRWGGCLNVRPKRGGTEWSTHSWGIAIDFDADRNQLKWGRDRAVFAQPEYEPWWEFWEKEGWVSLGRSANYDWMHVQAARLR